MSESQALLLQIFYERFVKPDMEARGLPIPYSDNDEEWKSCLIVYLREVTRVDRRAESELQPSRNAEIGTLEQALMDTWTPEEIAAMKSRESLDVEVPE